MGLLDALIGGRRKLKGPAPDRLFAIVTAQVTLETGLGMAHKGVAGIVFQPLATADFESIVQETDELLHGTAAETGTEVESADDQFGYRWLILRDEDFEDLVVSLNTVSTQLQGGGYGDRLLACVFAFEEKGRSVYLIYNFKRGAFYPFVPGVSRGREGGGAGGGPPERGEKSRDGERELRLKAQLERELPFEQELTRWFPLWEIPL